MTEKDANMQLTDALPAQQLHIRHQVPNNKVFIIFFYLVEIIIIILYATLTQFGPSTEFIGVQYNWFVQSADYKEDQLTEQQATGVHENIRLYPSYQDIHVMIFIGFGFLMTYLRAHSWTSVGLNLFASALAIQVFILSKGLWQRALNHLSFSDRIDIDFPTLIFADFSAGAVMITYGALLGQVNAFQLLFVTIIEVFFYALNQVIVFEDLKVLDTGGSMNIHTFGAVFGIVLGCIMRPKDKDGVYLKSNHNAEGGFVSNVFSFLGTMFLWMYWPSFNSAPSALSNGQQRAIVCTVLALTGSCLTAYLISFCQRANFTKFGIEDLLNATLAGGVCIGASADLLFEPFAAILIGAIAGIISSYGFAVLGGQLTSTFGMYDTCGVTHLHFLPGFFGGLISAIVVAFYTEEKLGGDPTKFFPKGRTPQEQAEIQVASTFISAGIAAGAAIFTGLCLKIFDGFCFKGISSDDMFMDTYFWDDAHHQEDVVIEKPKLEFHEKAIGGGEARYDAIQNQRLNTNNNVNSSINYDPIKDAWVNNLERLEQLNSKKSNVQNFEISNK